MWQMLEKEIFIWLCFNTVYNDVHAFKKELTADEYGITRYLDEKNIDNKARDEFLDYMKKNFPDTKLLEVGDLVSSSHLIFPYLGSIVIECEKDDEVFKALSEKYGNPYGDAIKNNAVFWVIDYENALLLWKKREEAYDMEFGD